MNRKLLNGLLVLAVAAGGVGTFTSCKDESVENDVLVGQYNLAKQIQAIRDLSDQDFVDNLYNWLQDKICHGNCGDGSCDCGDDCGGNCGGGGGGGCSCDLSRLDTLWAVYQAIIANPQAYDNAEAAQLVNGIYDWMFNQIFPNEEWFQNVSYIQGDHSWINNLIKRASSIELSQTYNPVFGTINMPIGLNSMVLATYIYNGTGTSEYVFPTRANEHLAGEINNTLENRAALSVINQLGGTTFELENGQFADFGENGNMGNLYATINPNSINFAGSKNVQIVDSKGTVIMDSNEGDLEIVKNDDDLSFGVSRAAGDQVDMGVYKIKANATKDNYSAMRVSFEDKSELKNALKDVINQKSNSSLATLAEVIYHRMQDLMPAYALRVWWNENAIEEAENGIFSNTENVFANSIVSSFDIAAAVVHPLSYSTDLGAVVPANKRFPTLNSLTYYLDKIKNKLTLKIDDIEGVDPVDIDLTVKVEDGSVIFTYTDQYGETVTMTLPYYADGINVTPEMEVYLNQFVNAILEAISYELEGDINYKLVKQLNDAIADINKQLADFAAQAEDITDVLDRIQNNSKLRYAQKLVDLYNRVIEKVNNFLYDPNLHLQVLMAYKANDGIHHTSNDAKMPTKVKGSGYVTLYTTSFTGDMVVPSYKKFVAITKATKNGEAVSTETLKSLNKEAGTQFNTVLSGTNQEVFLKASALSGYTVEISYLSVDYHGNCSMRTYYMQF